MPRMKSDRDDKRAGGRGPQIGDVGPDAGTSKQPQPRDELEPADLGAGGQRHRDGSSRDPVRQGQE